MKTTPSLIALAGVIALAGCQAQSAKTPDAGMSAEHKAAEATCGAHKNKAGEATCGAKKHSTKTGEATCGAAAHKKPAKAGEATCGSH